jgi:16S rRNA processing protein RimM
MNGRAARRGKLRAGRVGRPHGLDGSFYVGEPNLLLLEPDQPLLIGERQAVVVERKGTDERPIIRLDVLRDRDAVDAVRGEHLQARRDQAPELPEDEWWAEDLEGCAVVDGGREIGVVKRLMVLPSCEALEVERADGGQELLVPLVSDAVGRVDVERRTIEIDLEFLGVGPER